MRTENDGKVRLFKPLFFGKKYVIYSIDGKKYRMDYSSLVRIIIKYNLIVSKPDIIKFGEKPIKVGIVRLYDYFLDYTIHVECILSGNILSIGCCHFFKEDIDRFVIKAKILL